MSKVSLVFFIIIVQFGIPGTEGVHRYWPHVYSGAHFDETVVSRDGTAIYNVLLFMYRNKCPATIDKQSLPMDKFVMLMTYNREVEPKAIWWERPKTDSLYYRYGRGSKDCQIAVFFMKGRPITENTIWNSDEEVDLVAWVWSFIEVRIDVINMLDKKVALKQRGYAFSPRVKDFYIEPGENVTVSSYPGYIAEFETFPGMMSIAKYYILDDDMEIAVSEYMKKQNYTRVAHRAVYENEEVQTWMYNNAMRTLFMIKQPLFVHAYTQTGYAKWVLHKDLFNSLIAYYEGWEMYSLYQSPPIPPHGMHLINRYEESPDILGLTQEYADWFAASLLPYLNNWCQCQLQYTQAYGIWGFKKGTVLNMHVDVVTFRVINAMVVLKKDLGGKEDWKFEMIDYYGERKWLKLDVGDIMFYEASRLIHGFPKPFKGNSFVAVWFSFFPTNWPYYLDGYVFRNSWDVSRYLPLETESSIPPKERYPYKRPPKKEIKKGVPARPDLVEKELKDKEKKEREIERNEKIKDADKRKKDYKKIENFKNMEYRIKQGT